MLGNNITEEENGCCHARRGYLIACIGCQTRRHTIVLLCNIIRNIRDMDRRSAKIGGCGFG